MLDSEPVLNRQTGTCSELAQYASLFFGFILLTFNMHSKALLYTVLVSGATALSLPPLIPSIPGVTEPLSSNAPPLPILQIPTPPLSSPPFVGNQQIKPKKIGYFWTGAGKLLRNMFQSTSLNLLTGRYIHVVV